MLRLLIWEQLRGAGSSIGALKNKTTAIFLNPKSTFFNSGEIILGENTRIHKGAKIYNEGIISIGDNSYINPNSLIIIKNKLTIGSNCKISWGINNYG